MLALVLAAGLAAQAREETNSLGMKLVQIEAGEFLRGAGDGPPRSREEWQGRDADEAPAHKVRITRSFFLGATEVTNRQYREFDPRHARGAGDDEPVVHVAWAKAAEFCAWLSKKEGKPYRLPTEAEWEYACRAGTTTPFSTGATLWPEQANLQGKPEPVGRYAANAWGLHDLHGNVAEWCLDWYGPYEAGEQVDPVGRADGIARVVRGGSWLGGSARLCRSSNRSGHLPEDANRATGFRVVLGELPATAPLPAGRPDGIRQGPAPTEAPVGPYFVDFTRERRNPSIPKDSWGPLFSQHNHFAAACVCPNGDILAAWYTTVSEAGRELAQAASRLPAGADRWEPAAPFLDVPDVNDHAPVLMSDGKRIYHFFTQSLRGWDDASDCVRTSDDSGATWSKPRIIVPRGRLSQPCSAFAAKDGTIVLACDGDGHRDERLVTSPDGGKTRKVAGGDLRKAAGKYAIHPAVAPLGDGSIACFLRGPDPMPFMISRDLGETWKARETLFPGISVGQKATALRLSSGAILLVSLDSKKKLTGGAFAALSLDDGATWPHVRKVEGVTGYLSAAQAPNGVVYVVGSRLGATAFNEAWLKEAK